MTLTDLLRESLDVDCDEVWENERTPTPVRVFGVRLHSRGLSVREVAAVLELLGVRVYEEGTDEQFFSNIIAKHASIPAENTRENYFTRHDNQRYVDVSVLQSKTATLDDAEELDTFEFGPLPERPAGDIQFSVTFTLTEDGTLRVEVVETEGFAEDEIEIDSAEQMTLDAEAQNRDLEQIANEMNDVSATVEEIASSAEEVTATA